MTFKLKPKNDISTTVGAAILCILEVYEGRACENTQMGNRIWFLRNN